MPADSKQEETKALRQATKALKAAISPFAFMRQVGVPGGGVRLAPVYCLDCLNEVDRNTAAKPESCEHCHGTHMVAPGFEMSPDKMSETFRAWRTILATSPQL
jgi:hypothetical protein